MSFLPSLFLLSWFPARWTSCHFHCAGLPSPSASPTWAFAKLGFCCAWSPPHWGQAEVVSAELNPRHDTRHVREVCNFLGSVSLQQRFEMADPCYSSVTAQFYLASKGKYILEAWERPTQKRERPSLGSSFYMFFLLPLSLPYLNWASQESSLFHLSHSGPRIFFCSICAGFFLSLSLSHRHLGLFFPILAT